MAYQDLVALIESHFDPGAIVQVGEWVNGPEGRRDCDVSIRGSREGKPYFAFCECKDWKKRVGIGVVDALDSKRKDLGTDFVAIYSNSGYTAKAIQKAKRVGINTFVAVASGDGRSRARVCTLAYGRVVNIPFLEMKIAEPPGQDLPVPTGLGETEVLFDGKPVYNYLAERLGDHIREYVDRIDESGRITMLFQFGETLTLDVQDRPFPVVGLVAVADVSLDWVAKTLTLEVPKARVDAQSGLINVPPSVPITFWGIGNTGWEPVDDPKLGEQPHGGGPIISIKVKGVANLAPLAGGVPDLGAYITGESVEYVTAD